MTPNNGVDPGAAKRTTQVTLRAVHDAKQFAEVVRYRTMLKRILLAFLVGSICGMIIGAAGFALSERVFGRGIGILGNSLSLAALIGAVYVGTCGGIMGAIIGIVNLNVSRSRVVGLVCGVLLILWETWRRERRYFYEGGYFDGSMFLSDIIHSMTLVLGLALVAVAVSVLQRSVFGEGK